jgi:urea transporter
MRVIVFLVGLIVALIWIGIEIRSKNRAASNVMYAFAVLFIVLLIGAAYDFL